MKKYLLLLIPFAVFAISCAPEKKVTTVTMSNEILKNVAEFISDEQAFEGEVSYKIGEENMFGPNWEFAEKDLKLNEAEKIDVEFMVQYATPKDSLIFVLEVLNSVDNSKLFYSGNSIKNSESGDVKWKLHELSFPMSKAYPESTKYKFYIWNQNKKTVYVDNVKFSVIK